MDGKQTTRLSLCTNIMATHDDVPYSILNERAGNGVSTSSSPACQYADQVKKVQVATTNNQVPCHHYWQCSNQMMNNIVHLSSSTTVTTT